jgi:DNA-binding CsgD family transcriptional regulator
MHQDPTCGEIIDLAHHAATDPDLWNEVARQLQRPLRAQVVGFFQHNLVTRQGDVPHSAGLAESFRTLYQSRYAARNPWLNVPRRRDPGETLTAAELVPNWELVRTEFYRAWLRPQQVFHALIGFMFRWADEVGCVIALRPLDAPPFDSAAKGLLASVLPRLQCAWELSADVASHLRLTEVLLDLLAKLPEAAVVVDGEARPIIMNSSAELLLARHDGLALANGMISASSAQETTCLRGMIAAAVGEGAQKREDEIVLQRPSGGPPLLVRIVPLPHPIADRAGRRKAVAAIVTRPAEGMRTDQGLCRFYRMTAAEARLAALIVDGHSLLQAAADLRITKNTARTHMKRIYAKTDTHRQADLVRLLATSFVEASATGGAGVASMSRSGPGSSPPCSTRCPDRRR